MRVPLSCLVLTMPLFCQALFADERGAVITELDGFETVWTLTTPGSRVVTLRVEFAGGAALDPPDRSGLLGLAMSSLNSAIESPLGGQIRVAVDPNHSVLTIKVIQVDLAKTLAQIIDVLNRKPLFSEEVFERTRRQVQSYLTSSIEDSYSYSKEQWWYVFHGINPAYGVAEQVEHATYQEALAAARAQILHMRASASVIGDIDAPKDNQALREFFSDLRAYEKHDAELVKQQPKNSHTIVGIPSNAHEISIVFGSSTENARDDYFTATIIAHVLGGSISRSRLGKRIRFEGGLAYVVETDFIQKGANAALVGYIGTSPENAERVIEIIGEEWHKLADRGISQADLASAKSYLKGSFSLVGSDSRRLAVQMQKAKGLGFDTSYLDAWKARLESVSIEMVDQYLQKLKPKSSLKILFLGSKL